MERELRIYPDEILRAKCSEVSLPLSQEEKELLDDMYKFVKDPTNEACGLAAPQFGVSKRMFVARVKFLNEVFNVKMVNPVIMPVSGKKYFVPDGESCLSEPEEEKVLVPRYNEIILMGYDAITNKKTRLRLRGFTAAVVQHELDHLNGILLCDYKKGQNGQENE